MDQDDPQGIRLMLAVVNASAVGMAVCDANGALIHANPAAEHLLRTLRPDGDLRSLLSEMTADPKGELPSTRKSDRGASGIRYTVSPVDLEGRDGAVITLERVRRRMGPETAYHRVCQMATQLICVADIHQAAFVQVNPAFERVLGYTEAELLGRPFLDFIHPEDVEPTLAVVRNNLRRGIEVISFQNRYRCKDGTYRLLDWNSHPIPEEGLTYAIAHDITRYRETEEKLRESELKYRTIFENAPLGLFRSTPEGRFIEVNPALAEMLGYDAPEAVLREIHSIADQIYVRREQRASIVDHQLETDGITHHLNRYRRRDGSEFVANLYLRTIRDTRGHPLYLEGIVEDITEQLRLNEEKNRLETQFHQSQKLESVGRLAGGVAHDLNNLLAPVLGYGEMLLEDFSGEDVRRSSVTAMLEAGRRARDLVRQLLAFSRKQVLAVKPVNLNAILTRFEPLLRRTIREDIAIIARPASNLPLVRADTGQLEQVLMNLAVNAQDAMEDGGTLTIETAAVELDAHYASTHEGVTPGEYVLLAVSDTGRGMDEPTRDQVFEPFFTTKEKEKGTGLGLATVYGIIKQHGGSIRVYSEPGRGATFKVYLPVCEDTRSPAPTAEADRENPRGAETVLLAEDNEGVRKLTRAILARQGYHVLMAESGRSALTLLAQYEGPVHLLLTDVVMPDMNGRELYDRVSRRHPQIKVLFMSGYTDNVIAHRGVIDEGVHFIQKPFSVGGLAAKLREVLDRDS